MTKVFESIKAWTPILISVLSLLVAYFAYRNSESQTKISEQSLLVSKEQLVTAIKAYEAASSQVVVATSSNKLNELQLELAKENLRIQKNILFNSESHKYVFNSAMISSLEQGISHSSIVNLSFFNYSKNIHSYRIIVKSEGFSVWFKGLVPQKFSGSIQLDRSIISVLPNNEYNNSFQIWFNKNPSTEANLSFYDGDELLARYEYIYEKQSQKYLIKN